MAIMKILRLGGEAEVLGQVRQFSWDSHNGTLEISVERLDDLHAILGRLSVGMLAGVQVATSDAGTEPATVRAQAVAQAAEAAVGGVVPAVATVANNPANGVAKPTPSVAKTEPARASQVAEVKLPAADPPAKTETPSAGSVAAEHAQAPGNPDPEGNPDPWGLGIPKLPTEVVNARRLRTVLEFIEETQPGIDKAGVLLVMEKMKADIPLIARVGDLPARLEALFS